MSLKHPLGRDVEWIDTSLFFVTSWYALPKTDDADRRRLKKV